MEEEGDVDDDRPIIEREHDSRLSPHEASGISGHFARFGFATVKNNLCVRQPLDGRGEDTEYSEGDCHMPVHLPQSTHAHEPWRV
jgi:hypothetical protein